MGVGGLELSLGWVDGAWWSLETGRQGVVGAMGLYIYTLTRLLRGCQVGGLGVAEVRHVPSPHFACDTLPTKLLRLILSPIARVRTVEMIS